MRLSVLLYLCFDRIILETWVDCKSEGNILGVKKWL